MIGCNELKPEEMAPGMEVWIPKETAEIFATTLSHLAGKETDFPHGRWNILRIEDVEGEFGTTLPEEAQPKWHVVISKSGWTGPYGSAFLIVYNYRGLAIVASNSILVDNIMFPVFNNLEDLKTANNNRFTCAACGTLLNVVGVNCRICPSCEEEEE